jgi:uncharacterized protein (DUF302 family)
MKDQLSYTLTSDKSFGDVVANLEKHAPEHQFRVLHVHDVQATLAEKGLTREPLKIIEVCNSGFAHAALQKDIKVALFMPCKFTVYTEGRQTVVSLGRPTMISQMMPDAGMEKLANEVESTLMKVMEESV